MLPSDYAPPSLKSLILACLAAIVLALIVLITVVLPAEYAIDITGLGAQFGLSVLAPKDRKPQNLVVSCQQQLADWQDVVAVTIPPHQGLEYKFALQQGASLEYAWSSATVPLYFDFHGEPKGDTTGYFKSYQETTDSQAQGRLVAPFTGAHGWYWENKTAAPVTVILNTRGDYQVLGLR